MNAATAKIRVLVVDDHFFVRLGLTGALNREPDFTVVAEAGNGTEALEQFRLIKPDLVLMDYHMPGLDGVAATSALLKEFPSARVLMLSIDEKEEDIHRALVAGAAGYLPKATQREELLRAMRAVHAGERFIPPEVAARLAARASGDPLTTRELEVLELASKGLTNQEIGAMLRCSAETTKWHLKNLMRKLGATSRVEATRVAMERGILNVE
jgi:DNA-binding NarL/FixJ family response regulator